MQVAVVPPPEPIQVQVVELPAEGKIGDAGLAVPVAQKAVVIVLGQTVVVDGYGDADVRVFVPQVPLTTGIVAGQLTDELAN